MYRKIFTKNFKRKTESINITTKRSRRDGEINLKSMKTIDIKNLIRALLPIFIVLLLSKIIKKNYI